MNINIQDTEVSTNINIFINITFHIKYIYGIMFNMFTHNNTNRKGGSNMIICVNNNKGGVLKTTTVTNIAGVLSKQGLKILIVDCDNQSNVSLSFGKNPDEYSTTLYDVLVDNVPAEYAIHNVYENIDILPSNDDLVSFEFDVISDSKRFPEPFTLLKNSLNHLRDTYDVILIDTPPSLSLMNGNVFSFADKVLIPYQPEPYSMRSLKNVVRTIDIFKKDFNPDIEILGIVRTLVQSNSNIHKDIIQETNRYAHENNIHVFDTIIPKTVQFAGTTGYDKLPATLLKKMDKGKLYYELCSEIENKLEGRANND